MFNDSIHFVIYICLGRRDRSTPSSVESPGKGSSRSAGDGHRICSTETQSSVLCSLEEEEEESCVSDCYPEVSYSHSRLSKSLKEILADKSALGYFIQFMESRGSLSLIKFWMEVECICGTCVGDRDGNDNSRISGRSDDTRSDGCSRLGGETVNSKDSESNANEPKTDHPRNFHKERLPVSTIMQDASRIYGKYIAGGALRLDGVSRELKADIDDYMTCENVEPLINRLADVQRMVYATLEDE